MNNMKKIYLLKSCEICEFKDICNTKLICGYYNNLHDQKKRCMKILNANENVIAEQLIQLEPFFTKYLQLLANANPKAIKLFNEIKNRNKK